MDRYAFLLWELGHVVEIFPCSAGQMRETRVQAARYIFRQL